MKKCFTLFIIGLLGALVSFGQRIPRPNYAPITNGCGSQALPDFIPDFDFGPACDGHDICYGTCFRDMEMCDLQFLFDMLRNCDPDGDACQMTAATYYAGVAHTDIGQDAYNSGQDEGCIDCAEAVNFGQSMVIPFCPDDVPQVTLNPIIASGFQNYNLLWSNGSSGSSLKVPPGVSGSYSVTLTSRDYTNGRTHSCTANADVMFVEKDCDDDDDDDDDDNDDNDVDGPEEDWEIPIVFSRDPNDMLGPEGYGPAKMVAKAALQPYTIRFENDPVFATAPAQIVRITHPLHASVNPFALRLGSFGFGRFTFQVPQNRTFYATRLNVADSLGVVVDVTAGIDATKREAFWIFESKDPQTGLPPTNALLGFLPVNDSTAIGEGFVTFTIKAEDGVQTGDTIHAKASIVFDDNGAIETPPIFNTVDAVAPSSKVSAMPAQVTGNAVTIRWTGQDDAGGSGVKEYALYVSANGSPYTLYRENIKSDSTKFTGIPGNTYCFFTIATDNTGNVEPFKKDCEGAVQLSAGGALPVTLLYFKGQKAEKDVRLTWATTSEQNNKSFVVERSLDGSTFTDIGTIAGAGSSTTIREYSFSDKDALNRDVKMLYYRLRQVDIDGKATLSTVVSLPVNRISKEVVVNAYPNPFRENITVQVVTVTPSEETDKVELYALDGRLVHAQRVARKGSITVALNNLPDLKPGIYLLKTTVNGKQYTIKMVRQ